MVSVMLLFGLTGCFSGRAADIEAFVKPTDVNVSAGHYILQPADEIIVYSSKIPELHEQQQIIRPDGKVSFESIGEIDAAGKTPKQLADLISEKAMMLYALTGQNPIDVRITRYQSSVYYTLGQVYYEGPKTFTGRDTVLTALAAARPTILGWTTRVFVIRPSIDKNVKPKIFEVNYKRMIERGDLSKNVLLQEGDIIFVPPTVLAWIGMRVEELVRPIGRAFSTVNIVQGTPQRQ